MALHRGRGRARPSVRYVRTLAAVALVLLVVPVAVPAGSASRAGSLTAAASVPGNLVNYSSSADGFSLSYEEFLPAGYTPNHSYPLVVYLHGQQDGSGTTFAGGLPSDLEQAVRLNGSNANSQAALSLVRNASQDGYLLIAPNSRTGSGWFIDSPCGGPQAQDVLDAIAAEEAHRPVSRVYLLGYGMGAEGALSLAASHPGHFAGVGVFAVPTDLFQWLAYRLSLVANASTNASDPWAGSSAAALEHLFCGTLPGNGSPNASSVVQAFENMSPLRFQPSAFRGLPIWVAVGGADPSAPNNVRFWSWYMNVNNTVVNATCHTVAGLGEPANCTNTLLQFHRADPSGYSFRYLWEPGVGDVLTQLDPADLFGFWGGQLGGGFFVGTYPFLQLAANPSLPYVNSSSGYSQVDYNSTVDHFSLSYYEWLPPNYVPDIAYPLAIFLHGQQDTSGTWVAGGVETELVQDLPAAGEVGATARGIVANITGAGMILIALNTRSGSGFYIDSPCGGPQQQDVMDAIHHEESIRNVSKLYLFGFSMGTVGVLYTAARHPGMFAGLGIAGALTDLYEDMAYRWYLVQAANATDPWAWTSLQAKADLFCGVWPGTANASELSVDQMLENMSPLRFDEGAFANVPIFIAAGGADDLAPNNLAIWPGWTNANDTVINRTCNRVVMWNEPSVCTVPLYNQHLRNSSRWQFLYLYERNAGHDISQFDVPAMIGFWLGNVNGGLYLGGYPYASLTPNRHFSY